MGIVLWFAFRFDLIWMFGWICLWFAWGCLWRRVLFCLWFWGVIFGFGWFELLVVGFWVLLNWLVCCVLVYLDLVGYWFSFVLLGCGLLSLFGCVVTIDWFGGVLVFDLGACCFWFGWLGFPGLVWGVASLCCFRLGCYKLPWQGWFWLEFGWLTVG